MSARRNLWLELLTLAGFCAFLFYFGLGAFGLVGADEPRYAQIAREMLARRDLVTPTLYGTPWLEKPPLYYWRAMEVYAVLGVKDWVARLPAATATTFMVFVIYFFARAFRRGSQLNAALVTAASAGVIGFARGAGTDMLLVAAFVVGMLAWWTWDATGQKRWLAAFYFFMALGMLAKGPVAPFLAAVVVIIYAAVRREWMLVSRTLWLPGIALFFATALPWYIAVQIQNPEFFREFILQHNLERFATNRFHHRQPFWYYVPVYLVGLMPWTALFVGAFVEAVRGGVGWDKERARTWDVSSPTSNTGSAGAASGIQSHPSRKAGERVGHSEITVFLVIWILVVVVFFSFSESKLPGYILPAIPAGTLLTALWLEERQRLRWAYIVAQGILSGALIALALLFPTLLMHPHEPLPGGAKLFAGLVGGGILLATLGTLWRNPGLLRLVVLAPVIIGLAFLLRAGGPVMDAVMSERPVAEDIAQIEGRRAQVSVFMASREVEYGLGFYRNQRVPRYERDGVPAADHLVVTPEKDSGALLTLVRPRRASRVGGFAPQHLEYYWISPPTMEHHH
jgi:4-amino-4-deoxy-L-arabinose transferase-like glycosyltransferase